MTEQPVKCLPVLTLGGKTGETDGMQGFWKRLPQRVSLRSLFLMVTLCCFLAERGSLWMEARRVEARFNDIADAERSERVTDLDFALAAREKYLAVWKAPFTDRERATSAYEVELYYAFAAASKGPSDFRYEAADATRKFLIAEYKVWWDQKFPDRRREAELQALLPTAIAAARKARSEWCESERLAKLEKRPPLK